MTDACEFTVSLADVCKAAAATLLAERGIEAAGWVDITLNMLPGGRPSITFRLADGEVAPSPSPIAETEPPTPSEIAGLDL